MFAICGFSNALFFWVCLPLLFASGSAAHARAQAFMPETRGIPLEEVDEYFASVPLFVPASKAYAPEAHAREDALRAGQVRHAAHADAKLEEGSLKDTEKRDLEHVE